MQVLPPIICASVLSAPGFIIVNGVGCGFMKGLYPFLSMGFLLCYGVEILILGVYAICWQQIIKKVDISVAYSNRASAIFWSTLWAAVVFHEHISVQNIIGIIVIFAGIWMVNRDA